MMMQDAAVQTSLTSPALPRAAAALAAVAAVAAAVEDHPSDSDIGLDADKMHTEGDDYKIVFISSDSSKSSLEGSFDTSDVMHSTIHDSTDMGTFVVETLIFF